MLLFHSIALLVISGLFISGIACITISLFKSPAWNYKSDAEQQKLYGVWYAHLFPPIAKPLLMQIGEAIIWTAAISGIFFLTFSSTLTALWGWGIFAAISLGFLLFIGLQLRRIILANSGITPLEDHFWYLKLTALLFMIFLDFNLMSSFFWSLHLTLHMRAILSHFSLSIPLISAAFFLGLQFLFMWLYKTSINHWLQKSSQLFSNSEIDQQIEMKLYTTNSTRRATILRFGLVGGGLATLSGGLWFARPLIQIGLLIIPRQERQLYPPTRREDISWSPNFHYAAVRTHNQVHIWDTQHQRDIAILPIDMQNARTIGNRTIWTPDGKYLVLPQITKDNARKVPLSIFNAQNGRELAQIPPQETHTVAWTSDGTLLATCDGSHVSIWQTDTGTLARAHDFQQAGQSVAILRLAWSSDDRWLAIGLSVPKEGRGSDWKAVHTWDRETNNIIEGYASFRAPLHALLWAPSGKSLLVLDEWLSVRPDDTSPFERFTATDAPNTPNAVAWSPDGKYVAEVRDYTLSVWDLADHNLARTYTQMRIFAPLTAVTWSPDGSTILTLDSKHMMTEWVWRE